MCGPKSKVTISAPLYDLYYHWCYMDPYASGAPWPYYPSPYCDSPFFKTHTVYNTHTVNGSVDVMVNGSSGN